jgi:hypothetical protein
VIQLDSLLARAEALDLPLPGEDRRATYDAVHRLRIDVAAALAEPEFVLDCVERELPNLAERRYEAGLHPFLATGDRRIQMAFAYWPPGAAAGPHEHNDWAVTAVFHNRLDVETYDYDVARTERRLVRKNVFSAERGRVGQIVEPCVHDPRNPTELWSASLHLFGPNERTSLGPVAGLARVAPSEPPLEDYVRQWEDEHMRNTAYRVQAAVVATLAVPRARALLEQIHARTEAPIARISARTALVRALPSLTLSVRVGARAELFIGRDPGAIVMLRVDAVAEPLLRFIATTRAFEVGALPGPFDDADRVAVARALVARGLFRPVEG